MSELEVNHIPVILYRKCVSHWTIPFCSSRGHHSYIPGLWHLPFSMSPLSIVHTLLLDQPAFQIIVILSLCCSRIAYSLLFTTMLGQTPLPYFFCPILPNLIHPNIVLFLSIHLFSWDSVSPHPLPTPWSFYIICLTYLFLSQVIPSFLSFQILFIPQVAAKFSLPKS